MSIELSQPPRGHFPAHLQDDGDAQDAASLRGGGGERAGTAPPVLQHPELSNGLSFPAAFTFPLHAATVSSLWQ